MRTSAASCSRRLDSLGNDLHAQRVAEANQRLQHGLLAARRNRSRSEPGQRA